MSLKERQIIAHSKYDNKVSPQFTFILFAPTPSPGEVGSPRTRWCLRWRMHRSHAKPDFTDAPQKRLQSQPDIDSHLSTQELNCERIKGVNMLFEIFTWEIGVALHDVYHDGTPSLDVPGL